MLYLIIVLISYRGNPGFFEESINYNYSFVLFSDLPELATTLQQTLESVFFQRNGNPLDGAVAVTVEGSPVSQEQLDFIIQKEDQLRKTKATRLASYK